MNRKGKAWLIAASIAALGVVWWNQPYFGYNYCLYKGIMHETDFVKEMRPVFLKQVDDIIAERLKRQDPNSKVSDAEKFRADVVVLLDALERCVAERGTEYCRYIGPDENGGVRTQQSRDNFVEENKNLYRYIGKNLTGHVFIAPWGDEVPGYLFELVNRDDFGLNYNRFPGLGCSAEFDRTEYWND